MKTMRPSAQILVKSFADATATVQRELKADRGLLNLTYAVKYLSAVTYGRMCGIYELTSGPSRMPAMEGTRGVATLLVFFVHYHGIFSPYVNSTSHSFAVSDFLSKIGNTGVDLFFVLSGYLIYGKTLQPSTRYLAFMLRRIQRIYPTFLFVFMLYVALSIALPSESKLPAGRWNILVYILQNAALMPGIFDIRPMVTVAWSLSYEMFFYLLIPLLTSALHLRRWHGPHRIVFFLATTALFFAYQAAHPDLGHARLAMFTAGILTYEAAHGQYIRHKLSSSGELAVLVSLLLAFATMYLGVLRAASLEIDASLFGLNQIAALYLAFLGFVTYALTFDGHFKRVLSWTPIRWLGNMSYSYYLVNGLTLKALGVLLFWLAPATAHAPVVFWALLPMALVATFVTSTALFVCVEKPLSLQSRTRLAMTAHHLRQKYSDEKIMTSH